MFMRCDLRRTMLFCSLVMGFPVYSQISDRFTMVVDSDQNAATGCSYTLADGQTVNGVEQLIHLDVVRNGSALEVRNIRRQVCGGAGFGAEILLSPGGWPVGSDNGNGGADVIEGRIPLELFRGSDGLRLVLESVAGDGDYDVVSAVAPGGAQITYLFPAPIPTLGAWMILVYIVLMLVAAMVLRRRGRIGPGANLCLFMIALFLMGFAQNIFTDGQVGDWAPEALVAQDAAGDTPGGNPRADIVSFYACDAGGSFFFRFDVIDLEIFGPETTADAVTTDEETPVNVAVLANDNDGNGGAPGANLTLVGVEDAPQNGTATAEANMTITYTPAADFVGEDTFTYRVRNGQNDESVGTVTVTVNNTPDPPTPADDTATTDEDNAVTIDVLANDTDPDPNDSLSIVAVATPANGSTQITGDQRITYTPDADYNGDDTFTYTVEDGDGSQVNASVTVTVTPQNDPPQAVDDAITVTDAAVGETLDVLANDSIAPDTGETLNITEVGTPSQGGTVVIAAGGANLAYTPPNSFLGTETFTYTISDGNGESDQATVTITVVPDNNPPVVNDDTVALAEDSTDNAIDVLANDTTAPDVGETLTIESVGTPNQGGAVSINAGTSLVYTPLTNFAGTETFTYTANDGNGLTATATVTVNVANSADPPVALDDTATLDEDADVLVDVLANDSDPDPGDTLTITLVGTPANGAAVLESGQIRYTPNADYNGGDSFTYTIEDADNQSVSATVTVTVNPLNDPPSAVDDSFQVTDAAVAEPLTPLTNDSFAPDSGETLTITAVSAASQGGTVTIIDGGTRVAYTPPAAFLGDETFTYDIADGNGGTDQATVTVTVVPDNNPPVVNDDAFTVAEDSSNNSLDVLANDTTAPDVGETLAIESVGVTDNGGTVVINGGTSLTYTPAADFFGAETFTYTANDGNGSRATATVTVTVTGSNDDPTAVNDTATVAEDSTNTAISVLANDLIAPDTGETLSITAVGVPDNGGAAVISGTDINYTPLADFFGTETFTYTIGDGNGGTATGTVTVTVTPLNDDPTAADDAFNATEDDTVATLPVLTNDSFAPDTGETLTVTAVGVADNGGTAVVTAGGTGVDYTPAADFFGTETFTYTIGDGNGGSATATVTVTIAAGNDDPTANDDSFNATEDDPVATLAVLTNDSFAPDTGETLTVTAVGATNNGGTAVPAAGGNGVDYTPAADFFGTETFTYTIGDGNGGSATATVTVTVAAANDDPTAVDDAATVAEDSSNNAVSVLTNDSFAPDTGETLTITAVGAPNQGGAAVIAGGGTSITYTPVADFAGTETFTYTIGDGNGGTATATVTMTVTNSNDDPTAVDDAATVAEDSTNNAVTVLTNDSFAPDTGETLTITAVGVPDQGGAAVIAGGGTSITYTPVADFFGTETFTYTIDDGNGGNDTATVTMTVTGSNDPPTATDDTGTVLEDSTNTVVSVLTNDSFAPDVGETLTISAVGVPNQGGAAVISGGGTTVTYTPLANFFGTETFTYTIGDGNGGGDTATVTMTVTGTNDPPTANDDTFAADEDDPTATLSVLANDSFAPDVGETLTVSAVGATDNGGTATITAGGVGVDYTPAPGFSGTETFTYTVSDGNGGNDNATVTVNVAAGNSPPVADDETYNVIGNTLLHVNSAGLIGNPAAGAAVYDSAIDHLLVGDTDPDLDTLTVTAGTFATTNGGSITLATDGSFSYRPPAGFTTDSYTYTVNDGNGASDTGTITFNMSEMIWYFDDSFGGVSDGTSSAPFNSLQDLTAAPFADNHIVFIHEGTSTTPGNEWDGAWTLRNGMRLIGESRALEVSHPDAVGDLTLLAAGTHPVLTNAAGDILTITDAAGVVVEGLDLRNAGDNALAITAAAAATGVTVRNNLFSGHTNEGVLIRNNHTGDLTATFDSNTLSSAGNAFDAALTSTGNIILQMDNHADVTATAGSAIVLNGSGGAGSLFVTSFSGNSISGDTAGAGLNANTVVFDTDTALPLAQVNLGTFAVGSGANEVGGTAVSLTAVDGSLAFDNLNLYGTAGGLVSSTTSTFDTNAGGLRLQTTAAVFQATTGPALTLTASTAQLGVTTINSVNSTSTGISLTGVEGTLTTTGDATVSGSTSHGFQISNASVAVTLNRLDIDNVGGSGLFFDGWSGIVTINSNGAGSDISNTTGTAVDLNNGSANLTYAGSVANTSGLVVEQTAQQSGTVSLTGTVTSNGGGQGVSAANNVGGELAFSGSVTLNTAANVALSLSNNTGTTRFTGNLDIDTTTALGVSGSSGGTLHIHTGVNTLDTTNGQSLSLTNTTIGGNGTTEGLVWLSINSNGGTTGISCNNTGTGRFVVTGTGSTDGSGGTIQNKTARGAEFINASNISLSNIDFANTATTDGAAANCTSTDTGNTGCNAAVHLETVTTAVLDNISTNGGQTGVNGNAVANFTLSNSTVQNHGNGVNEHGVRLINVTGTSALTNSNISSNNRFNVFIINNGTSVLNSLAVTGCTINSATNESGFKYEGNGSAQGTLTFSGNTMSNNSSSAILFDSTDSAVSGITLGTTTATGNATFLQISADDAAQVTYDVNGNTGVSSTNQAFVVGSPNTATTATLTGQIRNNSFIITAPTTDGMRVLAEGGLTHVTAITNNSLTYTGLFSALLVRVSDGSGSLSATITGNNIQTTNNFGLETIDITSGAAATDAGTMCVEVSGNTTSHSGGFADIYLRQRFSTVFQIEGLGASGVTNGATVEAYLAGQNPASNLVEVRTSGSGTVVDYDDPGAGGCASP
ncbi:beta strand repeat-containing protein [Acanthopleuribacter pedis]|uniref:Tandem-95 repeat protein n=1 Tax=Acanthopleuribacter pedis TaxID=442870 RepID=A0A8J7Q0F7_9BACT|nr:Ig-like domain-containing protein [Acanthopleuribacter pedis]MBO1316965.1 tandem-95 repeat protein [Acanthopleuribacter pedis]